MFLTPLLGHADEREVLNGKPLPRTARHGMHPIAGIFPPNILQHVILRAGEERIRAVFVDSANPLLKWPDTPAYEEDFGSLELLVVVDVAMIETARLAHYRLPAASQFEKWEATGFNLEFPDNYFHLRQPLFEPLGETLPEREIYTRLLERMGAIASRFPVLSTVARIERGRAHHRLYLGAPAATLAMHKQWAPFAASILYRTLGPALQDGAAAAAFLLPLAVQYASRHPAAVRRAGYSGSGVALGSDLFGAILEQRSGVVMSRHEFDDARSLVRNPDRNIHLSVPEMLGEFESLATESSDEPKAHPFILMAGERRSYNANQIYRNPAWRKVDKEVLMRMHPDDAAALGIEDAAKAIVQSARVQPLRSAHQDAIC